jgi:clorobiocin biosynthesis protein CloN6
VISGVVASLPALRADLVLLHAPAFFDFRERRDIYFPFLGTSGDVPITPLYEYFPVGFRTLQRSLGGRGYDVKIVNLSTVLPRYPRLDLDKLVKALEARLIGIDLHWMVHVQGSLAVAKLIKGIRKDTPIIFGGISSTYYAHELIGYPFVDMVMRGYDTHEPMAGLLDALKRGSDLGAVPNLLWKTCDGEVRDNGFFFKPDTYGCGIDWSQQPQAVPTQSMPIREFLSTQNAGCAFNCPWCGGSRDAFRRINGRMKAMARKPLFEIACEFSSIRRVKDVDKYCFYSVGSYNESRRGLEQFLDLVAASGVKSISYEQFHLTPDDVLKRMVQANKRSIITLSPESHDVRISKLTGRGVYTNDELERWLERALNYGIFQVDIWYFMGMPEQDRRSVMETVDYCHRLLERFKGTRINPMICPMIPFLDPASTLFEFPEKHGYRLFHRTVEEHRRGMERASIINRINYETKWLSRSDLVDVGFNAVKRLMQSKASVGVLPRSVVEDYTSKIDDALEFIGVVHRADSLVDAEARAAALDRLGDDIRRRNDTVLYAGVMNQAVPINRQIGGRWFDELGWDVRALEAAQQTGEGTAVMVEGSHLASRAGGSAAGTRSMFPLQHEPPAPEE